MDTLFNGAPCNTFSEAATDPAAEVPGVEGVDDGPAHHDGGPDHEPAQKLADKFLFIGNLFRGKRKGQKKPVDASIMPIDVTEKGGWIE